MSKTKALFAAVILAVIFASPIHAEEPRSWKEQCQIVADYAEVVMTDRQNGEPMSKAMERSDNYVAEKLVIEAYEEPRWNNDTQKSGAIADFRDRWYLKCARHIGEK